ncbi:MAG TPA: chloride channel protein [Polyangiaceae bacterium]|nr:chloride channel protein [Polyangiaceae bacterium]
MGPLLDAAQASRQIAAIDRRVLVISALAVGIAVVAGIVARVLTALIGLFTNLAFHRRFDFSFASPADSHLGYSVVFVPIFGGVIVGLMARYGSKAIRGHGIPEAMEQVLFNQSRIPARLTFLKPISAAVAIGTGGPFGAEGPIIATGGAIGSLVGQLLRTTADERKTLLAAGAAAGMAATFGSPVSAVLLAVELLLFEYRPRSIVPVALAAVTATGVRIALVGADPVFPTHAVTAPTGESLVGYVAIGALLGCASVYVTKLVYWIEDLFEKLPIHWMWWPAIGGAVVGVVGIFAPHTMGVGYDNIEHIVSGDLFGRAMLWLCAWKLVSWVVALGSGTSGGTLAPLFTIGGGLGAALGEVVARLAPGAHLDPRVGALVGMAAIFAGASRALLASVVFAFEATRQPLGLLPLLGGCTSAYLISCLLMRSTIMTEKLARRGVRVPSEYAADFLDSVLVKDAMTTEVITIAASDSVERVRAWLLSKDATAQHQGYPVMDADRIVGVVTRRDVLDDVATGAGPVASLVRRPPIVVSDGSSLREAVDRLVQAGVGRLPVVSEKDGRRLVGIVTRSDLLGAHRGRLDAGVPQKSALPLGRVLFARTKR